MDLVFRKYKSGHSPFLVESAHTNIKPENVVYDFSHYEEFILRDVTYIDINPTRDKLWYTDICCFLYRYRIFEIIFRNNLNEYIKIYHVPELSSTGSLNNIIKMNEDIEKCKSLIRKGNNERVLLLQTVVKCVSVYSTDLSFNFKGMEDDKQRDEDSTDRSSLQPWRVYKKNWG